MVRHMENLLAIMNVYVQSEMCLCDFSLCLKERESESRTEKGFIALFFYARDAMNLTVCVCEGVCVCVCLNECR